MERKPQINVTKSDFISINIINSTIYYRTKIVQGKLA